MTKLFVLIALSCAISICKDFMDYKLIQKQIIKHSPERLCVAAPTEFDITTLSSATARYC